ncbi:hypothetical protein [Streptomyces atratus]|nr:hypothetical protein [Streptomyces atratus]
MTGTRVAVACWETLEELYDEYGYREFRALAEGMPARAEELARE